MKNATLYTPDEFTIRHLSDWFARGQAPCDHCRDLENQKKMLAFLQKQTPEDADYFMNQGWSAVFYRATQPV